MTTMVTSTNFVLSSRTAIVKVVLPVFFTISLPSPVIVITLASLLVTTRPNFVTFEELEMLNIVPSSNSGIFSSL